VAGGVVGKEFSMKSLSARTWAGKNRKAGKSTLFRGQPRFAYASKVKAVFARLAAFRSNQWP
jgi:hypothetical protein